MKTLKDHLRKFHNKDLKGYQSNTLTLICGICDFVPSTTNMFQIHVHLGHLSFKNFVEITKQKIVSDRKYQ